MPVISVDTDEIRNTAVDLSTAGENIQDQISRADGSVSRVRGFRSPRLENDIREWDHINELLARAAQATQEASTLCDALRKISTM